MSPLIEPPPTLGGAAALDVGTTEGTVAAGDDSRITTALPRLTTSAVSTASTGTLQVSVMSLVDCTAAPRARTLPAASSVPDGTTLAVGRVGTGSNKLTVSRAGSDTIVSAGHTDAETRELRLAGETLILQSDGVDQWAVVGSDTPGEVMEARYAKAPGQADVRTQRLLQTYSDPQTTGTVIDDGTQAAAWTKLTSGSPTIETCTDDPRFPTYYRITTAAQALGQVGRDVNIDLSGGKWLTFWIRVDDFLKKFVCNFSSKGNTGTDAYAWPVGTGCNAPGTYTSGAGPTLEGRQNIAPDEWRLMLVTANTSTCLVSGTPDASDIRSMYLTVTPVTGYDTAVDIADIRVHTPGEWGSDGTVLFQQDDGYASLYTVAYPALAQYGWVGNVAVDRNVIGSTAQFLTVEQIDTLYAAGWDIVGHDYGDQTAIPLGTAEANARACAAYMRTNGWHRGARWYVYPQSEYTDDLDAMMRRWFPKWRRRLAPTTSVSVPYMQDPTNPALFYLTSTKSLATAKAYLDTIRVSGHAAVFVFHDLVSSISVPEDWLISDFEELVDYAHQIGLNNASLTQLWGE